MALKHHYDPLLECLVLFARLYHRPVSVDALIAGLPTQPGETGPELFSIGNAKGLFSRVAERAGFATRLIKRDLDHLPHLLLPCILALRGRNACIMEAIDHDTEMAKVIFPDVGGERNGLPSISCVMNISGLPSCSKPPIRVKNVRSEPNDHTRTTGSGAR